MTLAALDARFFFMRAAFNIEPYIYYYYESGEIRTGMGEARAIMAEILIGMSPAALSQLFEMRENMLYEVAREYPYGNTAVDLGWRRHVPVMTSFFLDEGVPRSRRQLKRPVLTSLRGPF